MTVIVFVPLLVAIVGLLIYLFARPTWKTPGLVAWGCGLLVFLFTIAKETADLKI